MSENSKVSIIMNCYNGENYLREALDSVLEQTYKDWELIFWDNQSTDKSVEIFKSYADERLKYFYAPKHTLLYEARNCAIKKASGAFYAFLDVDDWWDSTKLEKQLPLFNDPQVGLVYGQYFISDAKHTHTRRPYFGGSDFPSGYITNELLHKYVVALLTIIVRRSVLECVNNFDSKYHIIGDYDLSMKISLKWKIQCLQEPIAFYRFHDGSESSKGKDRYIDELILWSNENHNLFSNYKNYHHVNLLIINEKALFLFKQKNYILLFGLILELRNPISFIRLVVYLTIKSKFIEKLKYL